MVLEKGKIKINLWTAAAQRTPTQSEACLFFTTVPAMEYTLNII